MLRKDLGNALRVYITQQWSMFISLFNLNFNNPAFSGLKGGSKRVKWKNIAKNTEWFIGRPFLIPGKALENPTRLAEATLRAYWEHWFELSQSGQEFTFKRVSPPRGETGEDMEDNEGDGARYKDSEQEDGEHPSEDGGEDKQSEDQVQSEHPNEDDADDKQSEDQAQDSPRTQTVAEVTPNQCHTDEEKMDFLRSLCLWSDDFQAVIGAVAQMVVSSF